MTTFCMLNTITDSVLYEHANQVHVGKNFSFPRMTALFNFQSLITVLLLSICTATYLRPRFPSYIDNKKPGFPGLFGRFAVIGERLSPYISLGCLIMALVTIFYR